jgi:hypothetical protein
MPTPLISENWSRYVLPIVRLEWFQKATTISSPATQFFRMETSTQSVEYTVGIGDFGLVEEYNSPAAEGQAASIPYDSFNPLYEKIFTHKEYAKGVAIERKLWDDGRLSNIRDRARSLGNSTGTTLAVHASSIFNNAFSSSYLGADSKALIANDHPNRPNDTATTIDNKGTSALSYSAVVATMQAAKRFDDDRGNPLPVSLDVLYVPPELEATAYEITKAINKPGTADNDANFLNSQGLKVVVDPYLTDANNWFMFNSALAREHLVWFWRVRPEVELDPSSDYNLVAKYRVYMRYSFGWSDFRWIYGHEVT